MYPRLEAFNKDMHNSRHVCFGFFFPRLRIRAVCRSWQDRAERRDGTAEEREQYNSLVSAVKKILNVTRSNPFSQLHASLAVFRNTSLQKGPETALKNMKIRSYLKKKTKKKNMHLDDALQEQFTFFLWIEPESSSTIFTAEERFLVLA